MSRILTVDDSKWVCQMVSQTLKAEGHHVSHAEDGRLGMAVAKNQSFDLVLTDIHMPNMNGLDLVKNLRSLSHYETVPILCLTMETSRYIRDEAKALGANGWLVKPFLPEQLVEVVSQFLTIGPPPPSHRYAWL